VEIANVAREPGYRSKIAVVSNTDGVDPVGACVGPRGSRVRMVVSELRGEKIDIIPYNEEPARFVAKALSPARVREVLVDDEAKQATVIVPDDQLSLAIGREGQNARLAARLTGWRVDIRSETEFAAEEAEHGYEEEEVQGRCAAVLSNGRRCPNAALPNSRYCGLETHQALANIDSDNIADLAVTGSEAPTGNVVETPTGEDQVAAVAAEPTEAGGEASEQAADAGPVAHDVAEESGPLGETEAAVIAPEPTEDGAEAARELAEKLEAEAPAEEPAP
jgi:N utilization substance protein A